VRNDFLEVKDDEVFERTPAALLEIFLLLQQEPGLKGVSARTIRLIRRALP
jgi:[protein-PII] uridylyltransferase